MPATITMDTDLALKQETEKWLIRLEEKVKNIKPIDSRAKWAVENIKAYISDCRHFQKNRDLVNAFEAIVYAYGIYETALHSKLIE